LSPASITGLSVSKHESTYNQPEGDVPLPPYDVVFYQTPAYYLIPF